MASFFAVPINATVAMLTVTHFHILDVLQLLWSKATYSNNNGSEQKIGKIPTEVKKYFCYVSFTYSIKKTKQNNFQ